MRLGKIEKLILYNLYGVENKCWPLEDFYAFKYKRWRMSKGPWSSPTTLMVRNNIFDVETITPSNKASFSRALRRLDEKGLITTMNYVSLVTYRTHFFITDKGEETVKSLLKVNFPFFYQKLTSTSCNGALEVVE